MIGALALRVDRTSSLPSLFLSDGAATTVAGLILALFLLYQPLRICFIRDSVGSIR